MVPPRESPGGCAGFGQAAPAGAFHCVRREWPETRGERQRVVRLYFHTASGAKIATIAVDQMSV